MHKVGMTLVGLGAAVIAIDLVAGYQANQAAQASISNPTPQDVVAMLPSWYSSTLGQIENVWPLPVSLGLSLVIAGVSVMAFG